MFSEKFLDSVKNHQITLIQHNDEVTILSASIPNEGSHLAFSVIYHLNRTIITGDMGDFVLGGIINPLSFFLNNKAAFSFDYMASKVLSDDRNFSVYIFSEEQAEKVIKKRLRNYLEDLDELDEKAEWLEALKAKVAELDYSSKYEVERFFYHLTPQEWDVFEELDISDCEVISDQFEWCIQAIIWITQKANEQAV